MTDHRASRRTHVVALATLGIICLAAAFGGGWVLGTNSPDSAVQVAPVAAGSTSTVRGAVPAPLGLPSNLPTGVVTTRSTSAAESSVSVKLPPANKAKKPPVPAFTCPAVGEPVSDAGELKKALRKAQPGDVIRLANGTYPGKFRAEVSGTAKKPIYLCGGRKAVLDAGSVNGGYVMHLDHVSYWRLSGFTARNGQKGVMVDGANRIAVQNLLVETIGDEGIHLRAGTTNSVVRGNTVRDTGHRKPKFGEGVYIGSAKSNWCKITKCQPDPSDNNFVLRNKISATTSEAVDIKEGTTGGVVAGNTFNGSAMTGADSWVDVKGNGYLISGNRGTKAPTDGFQTHEIVSGWGDRNLFLGNVSTVQASGYAIKLTPQPRGNVVGCSNKEKGARAGLSNTRCRK